MPLHHFPDAVAILFKLPPHLQDHFGTLGHLYVPPNLGTPSNIQQMDNRWLKCRRKALPAYHGEQDPLELEQEPRDWLGRHFPLKFPQCWDPNAEERECIKKKFQKKSLEVPGVNALRRALVAALEAGVLQWNPISGRSWLNHNVKWKGGSHQDSRSPNPEPPSQPSTTSSSAKSYPAKASSPKGFPAKASPAKASSTKGSPENASPTKVSPAKTSSANTPTKASVAKASPTKVAPTKEPPTVVSPTTPPSRKVSSTKRTSTTTPPTIASPKTPTVVPKGPDPGLHKTAINTLGSLALGSPKAEDKISDPKSPKTSTDPTAPAPTKVQSNLLVELESPEIRPETVAPETPELWMDLLELEDTQVKPDNLASESPKIQPKTLDSQADSAETSEGTTKVVADFFLMDTPRLPNTFTVLKPSSLAASRHAETSTAYPSQPPPIPWATKPKYNAELGRHESTDYMKLPTQPLNRDNSTVTVSPLGEITTTRIVSVRADRYRLKPYTVLTPW